MAIQTAVDHLARLGDGLAQEISRRARVVQAMIGAYKGVTRHSITKETEEMLSCNFVSGKVNDWLEFTHFLRREVDFAPCFLG